MVCEGGQGTPLFVFLWKGLRPELECLLPKHRCCVHSLFHSVVHIPSNFVERDLLVHCKSVALQQEFTMPKYKSPVPEPLKRRLMAQHSSVGLAAPIYYPALLGSWSAAHKGDYCDVYLTHDSMSVRKAHNSGRNHLRNVVDYYQRLSMGET